VNRLLLPQPIASTSQWQLSDWLDQSYTSAAAAGGIAQIVLPQLPYNERWELTHMVVGCTSSTATSLRLYRDSASNPNLRDGSSTGNFDVADWAAGLKVLASSGLIAVWNGASDGAVATLTVQANIYRLSGT
jgi:hypothetical protein